MLEGQMLKMAAAALGITPEEVQATMTAMGTFITTAGNRLENLERMVSEIHAAAYPPGSLPLIDNQSQDIQEANGHVKKE
jgi:hypothetical protein